MTTCNSNTGDESATTTDTTSTPTKCDRDRTNNCWIEGESYDPETGEGGICMLDTLSEEQVVYILQRDEKARADLLRVTSDERLLELAGSVPRLTTQRPGDQLQRETNKNPESIPFYTQFRGKPPYNG